MKFGTGVFLTKSCLVRTFLTKISSKIIIYAKAQINFGPYFTHFSTDSSVIQYKRCPLNAFD